MQNINPEQATLLDVRTKEEFKQENIRGSVNIPVDEILFNLDEIGSMKKPLLVYCQSGNRSRMAVHLMTQSGITEVYDGGGIEDIKKIKKANV